MLKIRIEGKENEIYRFVDLIRENQDYEVNSISRLYRNNAEISIYSRCYVEIEFGKDEDYRYDS